ncbi:MAG: hypothetical protein E4H36_06120 [Spirochaetales bacterium]|nr:MAG: hypothetical protein E4H36_06120 [Spirochaetales bacterium]
MEEEKFKRSNLVIDKRFQYNLVVTFLVAVLITLMVFSAGFACYYWISSYAGDNLFKEFITISKQVTVYRETVVDGEVVKEKFFDTRVIPGVKRMHLVVPPILVNNLLLMIVVSFIGLRYSHRLAGPAFRMMTDIQRVLDGEEKVRIHLREKDKFQELAVKINDLIAKLETRRGSE